MEVPMKRLVLVFNKEKETKGTYRYQEVEVAERDTAVGSLYLKKAVVGDPPPAQLRVTIEQRPLLFSSGACGSAQPARSGTIRASKDLLTGRPTPGPPASR